MWLWAESRGLEPPCIYHRPWQGVRERQYGDATAARGMQQAAKLVASLEQRGWASGRELPATCAAVSLRLLEKGPNHSPFWKTEQQARTHLFNAALMLGTTTVQNLA